VSSGRAKYLASILNRCGAVDRREEGEGERIKGSERAERSGVAHYAESKEQEPERDDGRKERREIDLDRHREFSDSRGITFDIVLANASRTERNKGVRATHPLSPYRLNYRTRDYIARITDDSRFERPMNDVHSSRFMAGDVSGDVSTHCLPRAISAIMQIFTFKRKAGERRRV